MNSTKPETELNKIISAEKASTSFEKSTPTNVIVLHPQILKKIEIANKVIVNKIELKDLKNFKSTINVSANNDMLSETDKTDYEIASTSTENPNRQNINSNKKINQLKSKNIKNASTISNLPTNSNIIHEKNILSKDKVETQSTSKNKIQLTPAQENLLTFLKTAEKKNINYLDDVNFNKLTNIYPAKMIKKTNYTYIDNQLTDKINKNKTLKSANLKKDIDAQCINDNQKQSNVKIKLESNKNTDVDNEGNNLSMPLIDASCINEPFDNNSEISDNQITDFENRTNYLSMPEINMKAQNNDSISHKSDLGSNMIIKTEPKIVNIKKSDEIKTETSKTVKFIKIKNINKLKKNSTMTNKNNSSVKQVMNSNESINNPDVVHNSYSESKSLGNDNLVRKSVRKRKLPSLHKNYVTNMKVPKEEIGENESTFNKKVIRQYLPAKKHINSSVSTISVEENKISPKKSKITLVPINLLTGKINLDLGKTVSNKKQVKESQLNKEVEIQKEVNVNKEKQINSIPKENIQLGQKQVEQFHLNKDSKIQKEIIADEEQINSTLNINESEANKSEEINNQSINETLPKTKAKVGRPRKIPPSEGIISFLNANVSNESFEKRRPGRPKKSPGRPRKNTSIRNVETKEVPENTNMTTKKRPHKYIMDDSLEEDLNKSKIIKLDEDDKNQVTCGVCNKSMLNKNWKTHILKHNYLCWKVGEEKPDIDNSKVAELIIRQELKKNSKALKVFICENCGLKRKSVVGYLMHREICQKTDEEISAVSVKCEVCGKEVRPVSMKYHITTHQEKPIETMIKSPPDPLSFDKDDKSKRRAALKAQNLINEVATDEVTNDNHSKYYMRYGSKKSIFLNYGKLKKLNKSFEKGNRSCIFPKCSFKTDVYDTLKTHIQKCPSVNVNDYICRICFKLEKNLELIKQHLTNVHFNENISDNYAANESIEEDNESEEDETDSETNFNFDEEKSRTSDKRISSASERDYSISFLSRLKRMMSGFKTGPFLPAIKWMLEFYATCTMQLFPHIKFAECNFTPVPLTEQEKYLPPVKKSMKVKVCTITETFPNLQQQEDHEWKQYTLFESTVDNDTITIFCGGPIVSLAWAPTPYDSICDQYLAVSIQKDFNKSYEISKSYSENEVIQFWNFGPLRFKESLTNKPTLAFNIVHNHGVAWCMEWCPSGICELENPESGLQRLGLLALGCSDGNIYIYAIGMLDKIKTNSENNFYKSKPEYKLISQNENDQLLGLWQYQVTKLCWSKGNGHNIIVAGYTNGIVCMWDINTESILLKEKKHDINILKPIFSFQPHLASITALTLYPFMDDGKRWLATGSLDRSYKYWDLENPVSPIQEFTRRGVVTDGIWLSHWLCSLISYDEVFFVDSNVTTVQNLREFCYKQCTAFNSTSIVTSLGINDWLNGIAQGNIAGELTIGFPKFILENYDYDRRQPYKRILASYNELIDLTKDPSERINIMKRDKDNQVDKLINDQDDNVFKFMPRQENEPYIEEPTTYEPVTEKYGFIFCDIKMDDFNKIPPDAFNAVKFNNKLHDFPVEFYPITSLNKIHWNPNHQAYSFIVTGYQNGFIRLKNIRFAGVDYKVI